ncbi:hypothetical protein SAMN05421773_103152 [Streptomyces aidingensis]|uniref:Uncharacterized protein n=1 Tax=Streptomyces aidingensis TaxID=910347 RepID=A0A1I1IQU8_9ACTN|nr:hypothetical protein SAMN05421773_103152 [Streptomyces aidingensis]
MTVVRPACAVPAPVAGDRARAPRAPRTPLLPTSVARG